MKQNRELQGSWKYLTIMNANFHFTSLQFQDDSYLPAFAFPSSIYFTRCYQSTALCSLGAGTPLLPRRSP
eukprot:1146547-Pelagomonas_calceolata.AAC.2